MVKAEHFGSHKSLQEVFELISSFGYATVRSRKHRKNLCKFMKSIWFGNFAVQICFVIFMQLTLKWVTCRFFTWVESEFLESFKIFQIYIFLENELLNCWLCLNNDWVT